MTQRVKLKDLEGMWPPHWTHTGRPDAHPPEEIGMLDRVRVREPDARGLGGVELVHTQDEREFQAFYRFDDEEEMRAFHDRACQLIGAPLRYVGEIDVDPTAIGHTPGARP